MTTIAKAKTLIAEATPVTAKYFEIFEKLDDDKWEGLNDYTETQMHAIAVEQSGLTVEQARIDNERASEVISKWYKTTGGKEAAYQWAANNHYYYEAIVNRFN